jgi:hypothetical protein
MMYSWPIYDGAITLEESLRVAMYYLERTGRTENYCYAQKLAADTIVTAWRSGTKNKLRLANYAIRAVEQDHARFYPGGSHGWTLSAVVQS